MLTIGAGAARTALSLFLFTVDERTVTTLQLRLYLISMLKTCTLSSQVGLPAKRHRTSTTARATTLQYLLVRERCLLLVDHLQHNGVCHLVHSLQEQRVASTPFLFGLR